MEAAYIFDALRTPRGKGVAKRGDKPGGALSDVPPQDLVTQLISALDQRNNGVLSDSVARLYLGCVGQVGAQGGHIALLSRILSSLPDHVAVKTLNNYCVSGLTAIGDAVLATQSGQQGFTLAGGVECLSQVPFMADKASYYSDPAVIQSTKWAPPVMGAELVATLGGYKKEQLDDLTYQSHQKAAAAWQADKYASSVMTVLGADGAALLSEDELIRANTSMDSLATLPAAFSELGESGFDAMMLNAFPEVSAINHLHTIAHCPGMADGAALALIGSQKAGEAVGLKPKAKVVAYQECAGDPVLQFGAGFSAMESVLADANLRLSDIDLIEFMEAFAAVPLKFQTDYQPDPDKVNVNGGHLAMGHPMGATGAILTTTLVHELERRKAKTGMVVTHAGGGIGSAMIVERVA